MVFHNSIILKTIAIISIAMTAIVFLSCKDNMSTIEAFDDSENVPQLTMVDAVIMHYDDSRLAARLESDTILHFENVAEPYMEFPVGLMMYLYDDSLQTRGQVFADYAKYDELNKIWEARDNVMATNSLGDKLNTDLLFWNEKTNEVYSDHYTKVSNPDGVFIGENGFKAYQENGEFMGWVLFSTKGTINVDSMVDTTANPVIDADIEAIESDTIDHVMVSDKEIKTHIEE